MSAGPGSAPTAAPPPPDGAAHRHASGASSAHGSAAARVVVLSYAGGSRVRAPKGDAGDLQLRHNVDQRVLLLRREVEKPGLNSSAPKTSAVMQACSSWHVRQSINARDLSPGPGGASRHPSPNTSWFNNSMAADLAAGLRCMYRMVVVRLWSPRTRPPRARRPPARRAQSGKGRRGPPPLRGRRPRKARKRGAAQSCSRWLTQQALHTKGEP